MKKTILVTGAAGFIGYHLSKRLCKEEHFVIGIDNLNDYYDVKLKKSRIENINSQNFKFFKIDINDQDSLKKLFSEFKIDRIIHLAAQAGVRYSLENPMAYADSNLSGFINIVELAKSNNVEHLVYASSSSVYGKNEKEKFNENDPTEKMVSLYAATKRSNELIAGAYSHLYGLPVTGLRFFTVYGPFGRPDMAYFKFTESILRNEAIDVFNYGNLFRDFTYIDDIVDGINKIHGVFPNIVGKDGNQYLTEIYNIGNGNPIKLLDFIKELELNLDKRSKKNMVGMQPGDVFKTCADIKKLNNLVGYEPKVDFKEGIKFFIDWFKSYYAT
tara:strand:- start:2617 stop:3603 length:987 start_codon:yes stop_codon:yes gene_type:complete